MLPLPSCDSPVQGLIISCSYIVVVVHFFWQLMKRVHAFKKRKSKETYGVIQQIRGPNIIQFWSLSTPLEWTKIDILHIIYCLSRDPLHCGLSNDPPSLFVHAVKEWPLLIKRARCTGQQRLDRTKTPRLTQLANWLAQCTPVRRS